MNAVIDKGLGTLADIGQSEPTTFIVPQELISMVGRYGKHLSDSDMKEDGDRLESLEFDEEIRELLGLDDIAEIISDLGETEMDVEAMEEKGRQLQRVLIPRP